MPLDLSKNPRWRPEDLGLPLPDSPHATSVCLPTWQDIIDYEEGAPRVMDALQLGYPRFLIHPFVDRLFEQLHERYAKPGEIAFAFPSFAAAWRCANVVKEASGLSCRLESLDSGDMTALLFPEEALRIVKSYWQHGGEIISSRWAEDLLNEAPLGETETAKGEAAKVTIRERIASAHDAATAKDVFLFSSGMAAFFAIYRLILEKNPDLPTLQLEFPYLDSMKLQSKFGSQGVVDFSITESGCVDEVKGWLAEGKGAAGAFTEIPSNPLLRTANITALSALFREREIPFVIDDTIASAWNVAALPHCDAVVTSLTKSFSGAGDVSAGAVILNPSSPFYAKWIDLMKSEEEASPLYARDAIALEKNSRDVAERVRKSSKTAEEVANLMQNRSAIKHVWYPKLSKTLPFYTPLKNIDGGYGGLISFELHKDSEIFYDQSEVCKGPSLGTNFSLLCPYTMIAHYDELNWAKERGAESNLLRISVGSESAEDILTQLKISK